MATSNSRPFAVSDAMLIIATIAVGLALSLAQFKLETSKTIAAFSQFLLDAPPERPPIFLDAPPEEPPMPGADEKEQGSPDQPETPSELFGPTPTAGPAVPLQSLVSIEAAKFVDRARTSSMLASAVNFLAAFSLGLAVLCLRSPRPRFKHLVFRVRFIPVLTTATHAILTALAMLAYIFFVKMPELDAMTHRFSLGMTGFVGGSIAVIWIGLVLSRRFRIRGWLDWLGLAVGITWMLAGLIHFYAIAEFMANFTVPR
ncbi:MAG: hypothetical protein P4L85_07930 [Paludisphaera borealis]|uniref:hypothetical protein n=1 Tax=Paludisphaera borealis TaxID=1387353 RepID=UPI002843C065|nr:hypothetical protein [Paludisphaera borealis]MDR3619263.1 hypothetical protein [Paludisphaera borealis]